MPRGSLRRRGRRLGRRRAGACARCASPVPLHRLPARHRRPAAGLRRRPLRGRRGAALRRAAPTRSSSATSTRNVAAVREVARARPARRRAGQPPRDGPGDPRPRRWRAEVPYAVKIHGSALEYTVKPHPRFLPWAREGLAGARGVLVGSRHTAESLWARARRPGPARAHAPGPAGRRRRHVRARADAAAAHGRRRSLVGAPARRAAGERGGDRASPSPATTRPPPRALDAAATGRATASWRSSAS